MADFVHLHLHSEYSLLDGACRIKDVVLAAKNKGMNALAITDHGVMYGAVAFYNACKEAGIKPIIGCEVYLAPGSRFDKSFTGQGKEYTHLVLLVENETGYQNLIKMVSLGFTEGFYSKPRIDTELLERYHEGLIALSGCLSGAIPRAILSGDREGAEQLACRLNGIFGEGNFYLELQDHGMTEQKRVNAALISMSEKLHIPLAATNDVHYIEREDAETQKVLSCIGMNRTLAQAAGDGLPGDEFYLKAPMEMERVFASVPEAIENTVRIAERCHFDFKFGKTKLPRFDTPDGTDAKKYLERLALEGLDAREHSREIVYEEGRTKEEYLMRIRYELVVIGSMGYAAYYLIVADFVNYAKSEHIPTGPGRGSGAGSLIAYLIGITEVDPIRYGLLFEAFLNPERVSMPDFDIDFGDARRDEVIAYVTRKYGSDHVAQIVTFGTMAARAAVRDVGRVLDMPYADVDQVAKLIPRELKITLKEALEVRELKEMYENTPSVKRLFDIACAIEGMPRHSSTHAAGVVITDLPITDYVPLSVSGDVPVTQYDMDTIAGLGLLKFDFLAIRYLTVIDQTAKMVRENEPGFSVRKIPLDDHETYEMISSGKTDGMFQLESGGMRQLLLNMKPSCITDIMTAIALYRPGPMDAIPVFLANRAKKEPLVYPIDGLDKILDETAGVIVYQEQIMQIFRTVAGYSYGRADVVRRAISKKKAGVLEKERGAFIAGAVEHGVSEEVSAKLFEDMADFANYGFKKSHAAAYGILSYQTAYLKTHYPAQYYASLLSSVVGYLPKMAEYISECAKLGIKTLPPSVNDSRIGFSVEGNSIRFGLLAIKNVGEGFLRKLIAERKNGKYQSLYELVNRLSGSDLNKRQIESLIRAGAMDCFAENRAQMLAACDMICDQFSSRGGMDGQIDLFGNEQVGFTFPDLPDLTPREKLSMEKEVAGMYFSGHLLDGYTDHIDAMHPVPLSALRCAFEEGNEMFGTWKENESVTVCGILTSKTDKMTKKGDPMAFLTLEDRAGETELIVFPAVLEKVGMFLRTDAGLAVNGKITVRDDAPPKLIVNALIPLIPNERFHADSFINPFLAQTPAKNQPSAYAMSAPPAYSVGNQTPPPRYRTAQEPAASATAGNSPAPRVPSPAVPPYARELQFGPQKCSGDKTVYLRVPDMEGILFRRCYALCQIFEGFDQVIFYDTGKAKYIRAGDASVTASPFLIGELSAVIGKENVVVKTGEKKGG